MQKELFFAHFNLIKTSHWFKSRFLGTGDNNPSLSDVDRRPCLALSISIYNRDIVVFQSSSCMVVLVYVLENLYTKCCACMPTRRTKRSTEALSYTGTLSKFACQVHSHKLYIYKITWPRALVCFGPSALNVKKARQRWFVHYGPLYWWVSRRCLSARNAHNSAGELYTWRKCCSTACRPSSTKKCNVLDIHVTN